MLSPSVKEYLCLRCEAFQSPDNIFFFDKKAQIWAKACCKRLRQTGQLLGLFVPTLRMQPR